MDEEMKEAAPAEVQEPARDETYPLVYVGPTLKGTELRTFKIFADGVPEEYQENAVARALFVTAENLDAARAEIARTGSRLNVFYKQADEDGLKGGK